MQRPRAAEGAEREVARIQATLDEHRAERSDHVVVGDAQDRQRRVVARLADRFRHPVDGRLGGARIELHPPVEKVIGINSAQHNIGVGDGRVDAACAVARRPRFGAGALRPHAQHPAGVDPGDRAAARADGANVEHRDLDRQTPFDLEGGGEAFLPVEDGGDVGRGAAHVEGHEIVDAAELGEVAARDHAAGWT